jgi:hypothetical protein
MDVRVYHSLHRKLNMEYGSKGFLKSGSQRYALVLPEKKVDHYLLTFCL